MVEATILVVEDEHIVARDIQAMLEELGYGVSIAMTGEEAVAKAAEVSPDLVLMDIVLKGQMDGVEAAVEIRDRFRIPVIFLTAYADAKTVERAKVTTPYGYILKPFEERELHIAIELALFRYRNEMKMRKSVA